MTLRNWRFTVEEAQAGLRLDQALAEHTGLSRRKVREALQLGGVQVDRRRVRVAGRAVKAGQELRLALDDSLGAPPELDLEIVHEDAWILAVNKPAGLATQGTQASDRHDLLALLSRQRPGEALHLVHRLDQGTSGLLILARGPEAAAKLGALWQDRSIRKFYLARLPRELPDCRVDLPIGRLRLAQPARFACGGDLLEPRPALTLFRPATAEERQGLVEGAWAVAEPLTGRTHQIRVHAAALDAPILGDGLYGGGADPGGLWLHAWKLAFRHPFTGEELELRAEPWRFRARRDGAPES